MYNNFLLVTFIISQKSQLYHSNLAFFSYFSKNKTNIKKVIQKTKKRAKNPSLWPHDNFKF